MREALTFAARLKLAKFSQDIQDQRVQELIDELQLNSCADTMVGDTLDKSISGGERKRTSIGVELIADP